MTLCLTDIGVRLDGAAHNVDFSVTQHLIVAGALASGRTLTARLIAYTAMIHGAKLVVCEENKHGSEYDHGRLWGGVAANVTQSATVLKAVCDIMLTRLQQRPGTMKPIVVVVENFDDIALAASREFDNHWLSPSAPGHLDSAEQVVASQTVDALVRMIVQLGAPVGVHCIMTVGIAGLKTISPNGRLGIMPDAYPVVMIPNMNRDPLAQLYGFAPGSVEWDFCDTSKPSYGRTVWGTPRQSTLVSFTPSDHQGIIDRLAAEYPRARSTKRLSLFNVPSMATLSRGFFNALNASA